MPGKDQTGPQGQGAGTGRGQGGCKSGIMEQGRIAIPSMAQGGLDGERSGHFGHCDVFTLVDVEDGEIKEVIAVPN